MRRMIGQHWEDDVRVTWWGDDVEKTITIERWQDPQRALDMVAAVNADGGGQTIDGLGKPIAEVPLVPAMKFCEDRGIPWEKFLYGNEYDREFKQFVAEHSKLAYANRKSLHAVQ